MMNEQELDDLFARMTAPLTIEAVLEVKESETAASEPPSPLAVSVELEPGHYINELDSQVSFFEKTRGGVADAETLNAALGAPYPVRPHQVFLLCGRHYLTTEEIIEPPQRWKRLLEDNRIFIPWPDILAADIFNHTEPAVVMVQPDCYIAGLILNYYIARHGSESVQEVMS